jgi:hypothetical protein
MYRYRYRYTYVVISIILKKYVIVHCTYTICLFIPL